MKLFSDTLPFRKANFHCHTTCSDGQVTPEKCMEIYQNAGYDILAITDHRRLTLPEKVPDGLMMIPGIELDFRLPTQWVHVLGLGMDEEIVTAWDSAGTPQQAVDTVNRLGGVAVLAHPQWSLNTPEFIASVRNLCGTEIWNSVSTVPYNADRADSSGLLDVTWSSFGGLMPVFANDDSHFYGSEMTVGATMVQPEEMTRKSVLDALRKGRFYATQGPRIHQIEVSDSTVSVRCSEAETIIFVSNTPWVGGRTRTGHSMTGSVYTVNPMDRYVRIEILDADGRKAWSAPIPVNPASGI